MTRATPVNSFKSIIQDIGQRPSPEEWERYGIPTGTPWKEAVVIRIYRAIIEENAYHLLPKLAEFAEPSTKRIDVEVRDWRAQLNTLGVSVEVVAQRINEMLGDAIEGEYRQIESGADHPTGANLEEPRNLALPAVGRSADGSRDEEFSARQKEWSAPVEPDPQTETPGGDGSL